jgi:hypothetical protein
MNRDRRIKPFILGVALLAGAPAVAHASAGWALAAGAGKLPNGDKFAFLAVADPYLPAHATGAVSLVSSSGTFWLQGRVDCLLVTGNRALLKGAILKPPALAGRTFVLSAVDHDVPVPSQVPDEVGLQVEAPDLTCPGTVVATTQPLVQGDVVVWSPVPGNTPPVAAAGPDQTVALASTVRLDGSASSDPDGNPLTFLWSFVSKPAGSMATLSDPTAVMPTFVADRRGAYVVQLVVNDGTANSAADTVTISTLDSPPVASAGPDQTTFVGHTVSLDGSGSSDPDGDSLTFHWSLISAPPGSGARLSDPTAVTPTFVADRPGTYLAQLIVNDGALNSAPDTVAISTLNSAPVANAGPDQTVLVGHTVTLNGSGSSDVDGDPLTFSWSLTSVPPGSSAALSDPTAVMPTFVVDRAGTYVARLIVNDGTVNSAPDTVTISTLNSAPVANAGPDQTAFVGSTVTLDGGASSDADGDPLAFAWSLVSAPPGSSATLSDPTAVMPSFVVDRPGSYLVRLVVNDGTVDSAPDTVTISTLNSAPVANAGPDQTAFVGNTVTLDGSTSSDVDGDPLSFAWSLVAAPPGSSATLSDPTAVMPSFVVDRPGIYVAQLIVNDGTVNSAPDTVTISTLNSPPVANAGPDQDAFVGNTVTFDGSASSDADGDPLTFSWSLTSVPPGSSATLSDPTAVMPSLVVDRPGTYVAQLIVNDGTVNSAPDTVTISTRNSAPVANAGPDQTAFVGNIVALDGSGSSDVDGDPLTFSWSLTSVPPGSSATLSDPTAVMPVFVVDRPGTYVAQLIVNDGTVNSAPDTVTISTLNSAPVANAGPDQTAFVGNIVALDGSGSSDVDGDPLTFSWSLTSVPPGSSATLSDPTAVMPVFVVDRPGTYVAQLIVNDGTVNSAPDTVTISTLNSAPVANAGPDQTVFLGDTVTLDGSGSSDVDGDPLTFGWSLTSAPPDSSATLSDPTAVMPTFVVDRPGTYVAQLIVNDGTVNSAPDTVTITTRNSAPVADAGPDQTAFVGHAVTLDGGASSDADGDPLTFSWSFVEKPAGSGATLSDPAAVMPSFVVDRPGSYVIRLIVNDGTVNSAPDTVTITTRNSAPVANAGADQTAFVGHTVTLDGSGSSDVDGDPLTFAWSLVSAPPGSTAALSDPTAVMPTFVVDRAGTYVAQLIVNDGTVNSAPDTVTVTTRNSAPVANAGPDQTAFIGNSVTLDGGGSSDVDGDPLTFSWSLILLPPGSSATLSDPTAVMPTFVVDRPGNYVARLIVNDGTVNSAPDTVTVSTVNRPPVADAGPDQTAFVGNTVTLDGSASRDADGDPLVFAWSLVSAPPGSTATLSDPTAVMPTFVVDRPGTYVAQLIVNDGSAFSAPDTVTISILNSAPVANAGPDQTAFVGSTVTLDGSASSDVDGDPLTFSWSFVDKPAGSSATLSDPTAVMARFVVDRSGSYVLQLIVNDGTVNSAPDTVTISTLNSAPVANAGPDQTAFVRNTVTLDGSSSSDPDGDPLTFAWSLVSTPPGSSATLSDPTAVMPSFVADRPGNYVAQLIVNDGTVDSAPDTVTISTLNSAPVANAGPDQTAFVGNTVSLDGSGSSDVDGDPLTFSWSLTSTPPGSSATLSDPTAVMSSFVVDRPGNYVAQLIVNDGTVNSAPDTVTISTLNAAPVANAGPDQTAFVGNTVSLDGSGSSDVDGDPLTFSWSLTSVPPGSSATLSDPTAVMPTFAVDLPGTYVAQLIVNDGTVNSAPDTVTISTLNSAPVANAGPDQTAFVGNTVTLDGSGSSDVDGDALSYSWAILSSPVGSGAMLSSSTAVMPTFVVDLPGTYVVQLIVNDGTVNSAPDTVTISTLNSAPVANAGPDQAVSVGNTVSLDGSGSRDADGDPLTFSWSLTSTPPGSGATLSSSTAAMPTFVADRPGTYVAQLIVNDGTVNSAPDTVMINAVIALSLAPDPLVVTRGLTAAITVSLSAPAPAGGLTIDLSTENPATASVPPTVSVPEGATSAEVTVTGVAVGSTTMRAGAPGTTEATATVNVVPGALINLSDQTIGKDLQTTSSGTLGAPAPAGNLQVTITSGDPTRVLLSTSATAVGSASIVQTVPAGSTSVPSFFVQSLAGVGTVQLTASAPGYSDGTATITLNPSGFVIISPGNFTTTTLSTNTTIDVRSGRLSPGTLTFVTAQALRGGLTVSVPVTSSNTNVGTITVSPVVFNAGAGQGLTEFDPQNVGTTTIALETPAGFSTPSNLQQIMATLTGPGINLSDQTIGKDLQVTAAAALGAPAPAGGLQVTITSADPAQVLLSTSASGAGSVSIVQTVPAGSTSVPSFFVQSLAGAGSVQVTASATGYSDGTAAITLNPSGFVIISPGNFTTTTLSTNTTIDVRSGRLNPGTLTFVTVQALRGGLLPVNVPVTSSNTSVGTITVSPVVFNAGAGQALTAFDPQNVGTTTIALQTPPGFSTPSNLQQITATLTGPGINLSNQTLGKDLQVSSSGVLGAPAPAGLQVTITSADPAQVLLSTSASGAGSASIVLTVPAGSTSVPSFFVQALAGVGSVQLTASATGFSDGTATITLNPSGFVIISPGNFTTTTLSPNSTIDVRSGRLNPGTLTFGAAQAVRGGLLPVNVPVTSSNSSVGTITVSPAVFNAGAGQALTAFDPQGVGTTTIALESPPGFSTPSNLQQITATVTTPAINLPNQTIGKDLQVSSSAALGAPAPAGLQVTITSGDPAQVLLSTSASGAGSASIVQTVPAGSTSVPSFFVQSLAGAGSVQVTASATGFSDGTATITLNPSGFVIIGPGNFTTTTLSTNTTIDVRSGRLNPGTLTFGAAQAVRGGLLPVNVPVTSSNTSVGTITVSPVVFNGGAGQALTAFDPQNVGTSTIALETPAGFSTPSTLQQITATVNP